MEVKSTKVKVKNVAHTPQKLRLVADLIREKDVDDALDILQLTNRKGTVTLKKAILSGIANARDLFGVDKSELKISHLSVDGAPSLKRVRFASKGRVSRITKRRSHINLELTVK
ncbi:MAG: 50S ribosomal protein L22 [Candidatus Dojkabacteria bacterium]|jgi:large subunit ribosomal protein L22